MSTQLKGTDSIDGEVMLTRYYGGASRGACLQVTPAKPFTFPYLCLTKEQALDLAAALVEFANEKREEAE